MKSGIETVRAEFARIEARLSGLVPEVVAHVRSSSSSSIGIAAGATIETIVSTWHTAEEALLQAQASIVVAGQDARFTPEHRRTVLAQTVGGVAAEIEQLIAAASTAADQLAVQLATTAAPQRPASPDPMLQEAQIAGIKADVLMVLDRTPSDNLASKAYGLAQQYADRGDSLAVWLLTSSGWADLYFGARGETADQYLSMCTRLATGVDDPETIRAIEILGVLNGPHGIRALLTLAATVARMRLDDLRRTYGVSA